MFHHCYYWSRSFTHSKRKNSWFDCRWKQTPVPPGSNLLASLSCFSSPSTVQTWPVLLLSCFFLFCMFVLIKFAESNASLFQWKRDHRDQVLRWRSPRQYLQGSPFLCLTSWPLTTFLRVDFLSTFSSWWLWINTWVWKPSAALYLVTLLF